MTQRRGGPIEFQVDGVLMDAKGEFTYNPGIPKREAVVGATTVHGYSETPQVAFIEGAITDRGSLDIAKLFASKDVTVFLGLANGKSFVLSGAWYAGDGTVNTKEGEIGVRFEGVSGEEVSS